MFQKEHAWQFLSNEFQQISLTHPMVHMKKCAETVSTCYLRFETA